MFSCEFWKISKNTFSYRISPVAASENCFRIVQQVISAFCANILQTFFLSVFSAFKKSPDRKCVQSTEIKAFILPGEI